ncbi:MAG: UMP kinase [Planctomycetota bacterium]
MTTRTERPRRVLLKLSGEAFATPGGFGIDPEPLAKIAEEVRAASDQGVQVAVVVGGGNIIRGATLAEAGDIDQASADYMGMLGTLMNGMALREKLTRLGADARLLSAIDVQAVAEPFIRLRAIRHLEIGRVVILGAGIGNPFFTTDTTAALRATELDCDELLKATKVDGVYSADPTKDPSATRYDALTFSEALERGLQVMDATALALCRERNLPMRVFKYDEPGLIRRAVAGEALGTRVTT